MWPIEDSFYTHSFTVTKDLITWTFSTPGLNSALLTGLKFQPCLYYKSLLSSVRDYMRNFQPRAEFNPGVEISALSELPEMKFQPWVELSPGLKILPCNRSQPWVEIRQACVKMNIYDL